MGFENEDEFLKIFEFISKSRGGWNPPPRIKILTPEENAEVLKGIANGTVKQIRRK